MRIINIIGSMTSTADDDDGVVCAAQQLLFMVFDRQLQISDRGCNGDDCLLCERERTVHEIHNVAHERKDEHYRAEER
jgi:hypothetical protein